MPEIQMPKLSDTMTEGTLVAWKKKKGDKVSAGDVIAEIETDKATMEWESPEDCVLTEIYVEEGGKVNGRRQDCVHRAEGRRGAKEEKKRKTRREKGEKKRRQKKKRKSKRNREAAPAKAKGKETRAAGNKKRENRR